MNPLLILFFSFPLLIYARSSSSAILYIPREDAVYRFKEGEILDPEDRVIVSTEWMGKIDINTQINVTFYSGCDIPLFIQVIPSLKLINLLWRRGGKMKRSHTIEPMRDNEVTNKLLLYLRILDGYINIVVNKIDDLADYQYRSNIPLKDLTRITVHGSDVTGTTIEVEHRSQKMRDIAASTGKRKGPNF
ncbi:hypothetical protein PRIPAC_70027 [Pristionchus pacificus]|uniref:Galectin domain-containing protein n=1 Tax=Pristionchus pacificus TaxID=54126 RepID=A0A2A6CSG8_PRIPA|nr:hypothetical protein PRIPAC_70027 [Pristionchus pacificus]|eukprot:PDM80991.1 hypothetical protein PRIPAC_35994 [Pristionchus pacificus]